MWRAIAWRSSSQRHGALEIRWSDTLRRDFATVAIELALARPPACRIPLGDDAMNAVGREKSVLDSLPQAVGVDRIAEIMVSVAIVLVAVVSPSCRAEKPAENSSGSRASCSRLWRCRDDTRRR